MSPSHIPARFLKAAIVTTAALFLTSACLSPACASSVTVIGLPDWLTPAAARSLSAVAEHITQRGAGERAADELKTHLVSVVADRLLRGYTVSGATYTRDDTEGHDRMSGRYLSVELVPASDTVVPRWRADIVQPRLAAPVDSWFESDLGDMADRIASALEGVPVDALSWGGGELREYVDSLCAESVPGWRSSLMVRADSNGGYNLEISFVPEPPLTVAISPKISSMTLPVMLWSNLRERVVRGYAPIVGLPVAWLKRHTSELAELGANIVREDRVLDISRVDAEIAVLADTISTVYVEADSRRYSARVWVGVWSGAKDRSPELGLHFGRWTTPFSRFDLELYGELIFPMDDWSPDVRLGAGVRPARYLWAAAEWSSKDDMWWARMRYDPAPRRRPYLWARLSEYGDLNAAAGVRVTDYLKIEIVYDTRGDDNWQLRALVDL